MKTIWIVLLFSVKALSSEASLIKDTFTNSFGSRDYYLYVPQVENNNLKSLVVAMHGCTQSASEFSVQSGLTDLAEKYGFIVVFPEQNFSNNMLKCWNWFKPENQKRNEAESSIIVDLTLKLSREFNLDKNRIFIMGLSAGAAMAANIFACHSDIYSGLAIHSGLEFRAARSEVEAQQAMKTGASQDLLDSAIEALRCSGPQGKIGSVVVIHGSEDNVVNPVNAEREIIQFTKINDLRDDGVVNGTYKAEPISSHESSVPGGHKYKVETYGNIDGVEKIKKVTVFGMKHAWSGAHQAGKYADPKGPDASEIIWKFLSEAK